MVGAEAGDEGYTNSVRSTRPEGPFPISNQLVTI